MLMRFLEELVRVTSDNWLDFSDDPAHDADPGLFGWMEFRHIGNVESYAKAG